MKNYLSSLIFTFTFAITTVLYSTLCYSEQANSAYENSLNYLQQGKLDEAEISVKNSIQLFPNYLPARLLLGDILLQKGQPQSAEKELTIALSLQADSFAVIIPLVEAKLFLYKPQEALSLLNQHPQLATEREYFLLQGNAYKVLNQLTLAKKSYQQSLYIHGETIALFTAMADLSFKEGDLPKALDYVNQALLISTRLTDTQQSRQYQGTKILKAEILKKNKEFDQATLIYDEILQEEATNKQALFGKASIFLEQNELNDALLFTLMLRENHPNDPYVKLLHSSILALQGNGKKARTLLRDIQQQFLNLSTEQRHEPEVLLLSANVDFLNESYFQAKQKFAKYISEYGENGTIHRNLATIALRNNKFDIAQKHINKALKLEPNSTDITLLASYIYQKQLPIKEFLNFLANSNIKFPNNILLRDQYINALVGEGLYEKAELMLNRINGNSTIASKTLLGFLQLQAGKLEQATITTQKLLNQYPNKIEILQLAAELSLKLGKPDDAKKLLSQCLNLDEKFRPALLSLAGVSLNENKLKQAEQYYQQLLTFYPSDSQALQLYADLAIKQQQYYLAIKLLTAINKSHPSYLQTQKALLSLYMRTNQFDQAKDLIGKLQKVDAFDQEMLLTKSKLEKQQGQFAVARKTLKILFGLIYDDVIKIERVTLLQLDLDDTESAKRSINRIAQLTNNNVPDYIQARYALAIKDLQKANTLITAQLSNNENKAKWQELNVYYSLANNEIEKAIKQLQPIFEQHKQRSHLQLLSQLYVQLKQTDKVISLLSSWIKEQKHDAWAFSQLANIAQQNNNTALAIKTYEAFSYLEQQPVFLNNLANLYQKEDRTKALIYAQKAHKLLPEFAPINDTLGWLLVLNEKNQQGLSYLREAVARDANSATYHYHLAYTLAKLKRIALAKASLFKAQEIDKDNPLNKQIKQLLSTHAK
jgi:putative PEP-CTERM system TPR-repeat lipoprotein